jgi:NADH-quinone oxidoreductase subunit N
MNFNAILPELVLIGGALIALMLGAYGNNKLSKLILCVVYASFAVVIGLLLMNKGTQTAFNTAFVLDDFARYMKILAVCAAAFTLILSQDYFARHHLNAFEIPVLITLATAGICALISARDLIALYMALELMSLSLYVLAAIHRDNVKATEAGLKYFVLGALSSGMLLYGSSLVYGFTGQISFAGIALATKGGASIGLIFGLVFILAGLSFKISAVPFHMWTPDVYEGAPTPITTFFAGAPKVAAMALFMRVTYEAFPAMKAEWQQVVTFIAIASMSLGAFAAIGQTNLKRLMAYSSIANMGFALVGLAAGTQQGAQGVMVYMAIYVIMAMGAFAAILALRTEKGHVDTIDDLAGLSKSSPWMALGLMILMFSMIGIPPLAGFMAKWYVFSAAVNQGLWVLAVLGVIASVVGCFYYLRIVKVMYLDEPTHNFTIMIREARTTLFISAVLIVILGILPKFIASPAGYAAKSFF